LRGICRAVGVGLQWLLQFMSARFEAAPEHLYVEPPSSRPAVILQRLEAELDELWSFVGKKANRQWIWIALDATTRQVIAFHVGDRSSQSAQALWEKAPLGYQQRAVFYTDHYTAYMGIIPFAQHRAISKLARKPNHLERFTSIVRYDSGSRGWRVLRCPSQRTWPITSESFDISFVTTTSPSVQPSQHNGMDAPALNGIDVPESKQLSRLYREGRQRWRLQQ